MNSKEEDKEITIKILTLGESTVGKSCIIRRYTEDKFALNFLTTIGVDFKSKYIDYKKFRVKVLLIDTSGQEKYRIIASNYYRSTDGILFVFDVSNRHSVEKMDYWIKQIQEKTSIATNCILAFGNKTDLKDERQVSMEEAQELAKKYNLDYKEGSALSGVGINETVELLVDNIIKERELVDEHGNLKEKKEEEIVVKKKLKPIKDKSGKGKKCCK